MNKTFVVFEKGSVTADLILENTPQNVTAGSACADLGVIMPNFCEKLWAECSLLLAPHKIGMLGDGVITYGMEPESDITLSSVGETRCILTVQRDICDIWGKTIEQQDIVISRMHLEPDMALATASALLLAGAGGKLWGI